MSYIGQERVKKCNNCFICSKYINHIYIPYTIFYNRFVSVFSVQLNPLNFSNSVSDNDI